MPRILKQNLADDNALIGTLTIQKTEAKERKVEAKTGKSRLRATIEMFLQELSMSGKVGEILTRSKKAALLTLNANSALGTSARLYELKLCRKDLKKNIQRARYIALRIGDHELFRYLSCEIAVQHFHLLVLFSTRTLK